MAFQIEDYRSRVTFADGDWRSELVSRGGDAAAPVEFAILKDARRVREVAEAFLDAGAELLTTPTASAFALVREEDPRFASVSDAELEAMNREAARICREAAADHPLKNRRVVGVVGPTARLLMLQELKPKTLEAAYRTQCRALSDGGVEAIFCRGFTEMEALRIAVGVAQETGLPVIASMAFTVAGEQVETTTGATPPQACEVLRAMSVEIMGCESDEDATTLESCVALIRSVWSGPIWITLAAARPLLKEGRVTFEESDRESAERAMRLSRKGPCILAGGRGIRAGGLAAWIRSLHDTTKKKK